MDLRGKVCLVTGGTSGIGAATALALIRKGAKIMSASRKGVDSVAEGFFSDAVAAGAEVHFLEADVADPEACRRVVAQAVSFLVVWMSSCIQQVVPFPVASIPSRKRTG